MKMTGKTHYINSDFLKKIGQAECDAVASSHSEMYVNMKNQSILTDAVHRVHTSHHGIDGKEFPDRFYPNVQTCWDAFLRGLSVTKDGRCYGVYSANLDDWVYISYEKLYEKVGLITSALVTLGVPQSNDTAIGIFSKNCLEWNTLEYTCYANSMMVTPLYDTFGEEAVLNIVYETQMPFVFCGDNQKAMMIVRHKAKFPHLKVLATKDCVSLEISAEAEMHKGFRVLSFDELECIGQENCCVFKPPKKEDVAVLMYTSGTTGMPKGVLLSHDNIIFATHMWYFVINKGPHGSISLSSQHCILTCLPKAHLLALITELHIIMAGGRVALFRGDIKMVLEDLQRIQPNAFPLVPTLLNRIYNRVMQEVGKNWIKNKIFEWAISKKLSWYANGQISNDTWLDYFLFSTIQKLLGGKMQVIVTGSAPIDRKVLAFARGVLGCYVIEAYGQTETSGANVVSLPLDCSLDGHVGAPLPNMYVKLIDVPEMGYFKDNDQGEICIKGRCNFKGYFKRPELIAQAIDNEGWVHTGDIGQWLSNGALKIIDRRKNIFKLVQGEYIAPEKIEQVYNLSPWVEQVFVDGRSTESFCVGVVVANQSHVESWAKNNGIEGNFAELITNEIIEKELLNELNKLGKAKHLNGLELIKKLKIVQEPFTVLNGLLTPTLKLKRFSLRKHFEETINGLYVTQ